VNRRAFLAFIGLAAVLPRPKPKHVQLIKRLGPVEFTPEAWRKTVRMRIDEKTLRAVQPSRDAFAGEMKRLWQKHEAELAQEYARFAR
jgi:hypothetical protein